MIQVMAWHKTGNKPLSEPMITRFTYSLQGLNELISLNQSKYNFTFYDKNLCSPIKYQVWLFPVDAVSQVIGR